MPLLAGGRLGAPGGDLTDASANTLGEASILVAVGSSGILYNANQVGSMGIGDDISNLIDLVGDLAGTLTGITNGTILMSQLTAHDSHLTDVELTITDNHTLLSDLTADGTQSVQTVLDAIAAIVPGGGLTQAEHDALLALQNADPDEIAAAVWHRTSGLMDPSAGAVDLTYQDLARAAGAAAFAKIGYEGFVPPVNPYIAAVIDDPLRINSLQLALDTMDPDDWPPIPDWTQLEDGDTPVAFLQRVQPLLNWSNSGPVGVGPDDVAWTLLGSMGQTFYVRSLFTTRDLASINVIVNPPSVTVDVVAAPVWPGEGNVTLGTPVALVDQLHLTGTMDGVIVACTTPPTKTGLRQIGGALYDYGVGEMAFETDSGDIEPWQYLGFRAAIFTPKSMQHAAGARFRVLAGAGGTVTPWVRS